MWRKQFVFIVPFITFFCHIKAGADGNSEGELKVNKAKNGDLYIRLNINSISKAISNSSVQTNPVPEPIKHVPQKMVQTSLDDLPEQHPQGLFSTVFGNMHNSLHYTARWGVGLSICAYLLVLTKLMRASRLIGSEGSWAVWRSDVPTAVLQELSVEVVAHELYEAIQRKYIFAELQRNNLMLMGLFSRDVDHELDRMHQFISLHARIDRMYMSILFPKQTDLIQQVHYYIDRLNFLKQILEQWMHVNI
ncbi:MAG TPA: hypothetical protein VGT41_04670 [Candidatus Babeliales bacterium]|nr:hypothetical protein [Candidatus Babeliales bacterium]